MTVFVFTPGKPQRRPPTRSTRATSRTSPSTAGSTSGRSQISYLALRLLPLQPLQRRGRGVRGAPTASAARRSRRRPPRATPTPDPGRRHCRRPPRSDADGDGVPAPADCWDQNATVFPGAPEVPGNAIDDDCAGGDAPAASPATIKSKWKTVTRAASESSDCASLDAPEGSRVEVTCSGARCPFKRRSTSVDAKGNANLREVLQAQAAAVDHDRRPDHLPELDRPRGPLRDQARRRSRHAAALPATGGDETAAVLKRARSRDVQRRGDRRTRERRS